MCSSDLPPIPRQTSAPSFPLFFLPLLPVKRLGRSASGRRRSASSGSDARLQWKQQKGSSTRQSTSTRATFASISYPKLGAFIWFRHGKFGPKRQLKQNNLADPNPGRFRPNGLFQLLGRIPPEKRANPRSGCIRHLDSRRHAITPGWSATRKQSRTYRPVEGKTGRVNDLETHSHGI